MRRRDRYILFSILLYAAFVVLRNPTTTTVGGSRVGGVAPKRRVVPIPHRDVQRPSARVYSPGPHLTSICVLMHGLSPSAVRPPPVNIGEASIPAQLVAILSVAARGALLDALQHRCPSTTSHVVVLDVAAVGSSSPSAWSLLVAAMVSPFIKLDGRVGVVGCTLQEPSDFRTYGYSLLRTSVRTSVPTLLRRGGASPLASGDPFLPPDKCFATAFGVVLAAAQSPSMARENNPQESLRMIATGLLPEHMHEELIGHILCHQSGDADVLRDADRLLTTLRGLAHTRRAAVRITLCDPKKPPPTMDATRTLVAHISSILVEVAKFKETSLLDLSFAVRGVAVGWGRVVVVSPDALLPVPPSSMPDTIPLTSLQAFRWREQVFPAPTLRIEWKSMCCKCCGFAKEIVSLVLPVLSRYYDVTLNNNEACYCPGYNDDTMRRLRILTEMGNDEFAMTPTVVVAHASPVQYHTLLEGITWPSYVVGRSMYELTPLPTTWFPGLALAHEIWVPSDFVKEAMLVAGVPEEKVFVVPEAIDVNLYNKDVPYTLHMPFLATKFGNHFVASNRNGSDAQRSHYKFLSVFKWEERKGWDTLFKAYFRTFSSTDDVSMYVITHIFSTRADKKSYNGSRDARAVLEWGLALGGEEIKQLAHVVIITAPLEEGDVAAMYRSCDAFVLPTRGEGWGLPMIQAMATGLPTITTNYSGMLSFVTNEVTALLIPIDRMEVCPTDAPGLTDLENGQVWAIPSTAATGALMRRVFTHRAEGIAIGKRASADISARFSEEAVGNILLTHFRRIEKILQERDARHRDE